MPHNQSPVPGYGTMDLVMEPWTWLWNHGPRHGTLGTDTMTVVSPIAVVLLTKFIPGKRVDQKFKFANAIPWPKLAVFAHQQCCHYVLVKLYIHTYRKMWTISGICACNLTRLPDNYLCYCYALVLSDLQPDYI